MSLSDSVMYLGGVGPKRAELLKKLDIHTVRDVLYHLPRSYIDLSAPVSISEAALGEQCTVRVRVVKKRPPALIRKNMRIYKVLCTDGESDMTVVIFNSVYLYNSLSEGEDYILYGRMSGNLTSREMSSPMILKYSSADKILPVYHLTEGISAQVMRSCVRSALKRQDLADCETLPGDILRECSLISCEDAIRQIHFPQNEGMIAPARRRLAFDELLTLRLAMLSMREKNRSLTAYAMGNKPISRYYSSLPFELTKAQKRAIEECLSDMRGNIPMNRLVLGDVGSGKTAVAAACCYFAFLNGCQSCLMAPTEILADQHYDTLVGFLTPLGVRVALLKGSMTAKEKAQIKRGLASGEYDVAVGTHALIGESTEFRNLSLVITDEQHRFGVKQRDSLAKKGENPHRLVMSATPIPRTLALMIYGELDISILDELPKGRKKIETYAVTGKLRERAYRFAAKQIDEGRQAYIVCPAIEDAEGGLDIKNVTERAWALKEGVFKNCRIAILHGKMPAQTKESVMRGFKEGKIDLLVCTTVVEVGVDVPNAAVMVVEDADRFGLSQLHQLRGRVGRGEYQSYCILIAENPGEDSKKRLRALTASSDGFAISEADLKLRGPGDFFGQAQHGLPRLKIADLAADSDLVRLASDTADRLYGSGFLASKQGRALKNRVDALLGEGAKN